jgi:hypothetical protein
MMLWSMYDVGKASGKVNGKLEAAEGGTEGVGSTFFFLTVASCLVRTLGIC